MYSALICGEPYEDFPEEGWTTDSTGTRIVWDNPTDLLQSELARIRKEISLVADAMSKEVIPIDEFYAKPDIPGTDENIKKVY